MKTKSRPLVFVGSSSEALAVTQFVRRALQRIADIREWTEAFGPGDWTLETILDAARECDFGVFIMAADDDTRSRGKRQWSVRDNVLFEAGVFMGAIGRKRTFLLWPEGAGDQLRLPSDLVGLNLVSYRAHALSESKLGKIRDAIRNEGPTIRTGYDEIQALSEQLSRRVQVFTDGTSEPWRDIIAPAAARYSQPWHTDTSVYVLMSGILRVYQNSVVENAFWSLVIHGVITFDNIDQWSEGDWTWQNSVDRAVFTDRGAVLLNLWRNEYRRSRQKKTTARRRRRGRTGR